MPAAATYPAVVAPELVGTYPALAAGGGGFVWDEVLEYRVWCHPRGGGDDYYCAFASAADAAAFAAQTAEAEEPLALIRQWEYIDEPRSGIYRHIAKVRVTEWPLEFLRRPRRPPHTIPDFFAPDAPANRLAILRGQAPNPRDAARRSPRKKPAATKPRATKPPATKPRATKPRTTKPRATKPRATKPPRRR